MILHIYMYCSFHSSRERPLGVKLAVSWDIDNVLYYIYKKPRYQPITKLVKLIIYLFFNIILIYVLYTTYKV